MVKKVHSRVRIVPLALLLVGLLFGGCDLMEENSSPQTPKFEVTNDLESRMTPLEDSSTTSLQGGASATMNSSNSLLVFGVLRVAPPDVNGTGTVASYLSYDSYQGPDRVSVGYKVRGEEFGGGIDILNALTPLVLNPFPVNSIQATNLDVQEVVGASDSQAQYVAGAVQTNLADESPSVIAKLSFPEGEDDVDITSKRLSANVAKSVVNAPSGDAQYDLYAVTDGNSLYRFTSNLGDKLRQTAPGANFSSVAAHQGRIVTLDKNGELWYSTPTSTGDLSKDNTPSFNGTGINPLGIARVRTATHEATNDQFVFVALNQGGFRVLNAEATTELFGRTSGNYTSVSASGNGNLLFASRDNGQIEVYEFTGSTGNPSWTSSPIATINTRDFGDVPPETQVNQVLAIGNILYVANSRGGLLVLKVI